MLLSDNPEQVVLWWTLSIRSAGFV